MEAVFHEKQEGALCAQHCLNALLQGPYYTAVDLASLARQLDEDERLRMAENANREEYDRFLQQPSANMDDTGFFSLQVLTKAIEVWGLELVNWNSSDARAVQARRNPTCQRAFICNFREHWFTIRRLGHQWFDLNSLLSAAALITDTYLTMYLEQLQQEGYSIYVVLGDLPNCLAEDVLSVQPAVQLTRPKLMSADEVRGTGIGTGPGPVPVPSHTGARSKVLPQLSGAGVDEGMDDEALREALAMSLAQQQPVGAKSFTDDDDELKLALQLSQSMVSSPGAKDADTLDRSGVLSEEDDIQMAIEMSLANKIGKPKTLPKSDSTTTTKTRHDPVSQRTFSQPQKAVRKPMKPPGANIVGINRVRSPERGQSNPQPSQHGFVPPTASQLQSSRPLASRHLSPPSSPPFDLGGPSTTSRPHLRHVGPGSHVVGGQRLGGESTDSPARYQGLARQTTPDPEEVRRRRLAFLDRLVSDDESNKNQTNR